MFVDEGLGSFGVYMKKMFLFEFILRLVDEGIFFDEWDLFLKLIIIEDVDIIFEVFLL